MAKPPTLAHDKAARARKGAGNAARGPAGAGNAKAALRRAEPGAQAIPHRIDGVDGARGVAILAMIAYHFCFDLRFYGLTRADFEHDPFWLTARSLIVTGFLLVVGISAVLAHGATGTGDADAKADPRLWRYLRRTAIVAACAVAVSAGSYLLFPQSFIYFGILHAIVLMSLVAWPFTSRPRAALMVGAIIIALGLTASSALFDTRLLSIVGFMTHKPITEDYVPLFPWTGVVLVGVMLGSLLQRRAFAPLAPFARLPRFVHFLGRHSLAVYMTHQLVLLGGLWVVLHVAGRQ